ncbi:ABC transporter permease [Dactylosporangium sp. CA-092794]|uniref:ABC transporter permease n=1 Tax=Dactylosporangium sp. CA-092794 TaxID=3239929 RepID=UPI003D8ECDDD
MPRSITTYASFAGKLLVRLAGGLLLLATASFLLVQAMPGDPVVRLLGGDASEADIARARTALGLDDPFYVRYLDFIRRIFTFDFGSSFTGEPVTSVLGDRAWHTAVLAGTSMVVTAVLSVVAGLVAAAVTQGERRSGFAHAFTTVTGFLAAVPSYVLAMGLVALFAVTLELFSVAGADGPSSLVLPVTALSLPAAAVLCRIVRVEALSVLESDFVRTVRSKQLPRTRLYLRHVLPNVVTGALTIGGVMFGYLLGGSVIVENVFQWPGLGTEMVHVINTRDFPVLQTAIIFIGVGVLAVNSIVDVVLFVLDPRIRAAS